MERTVTTEATARRETAPELARVDLTVTAGGESAATARAAVDDRAASVREPLTTVVDAADVRTTGQRIESTGEVFDPRVDDAFQATVELTVDCVPETAEDVVVAATDAGATVDRVEWHPHESVCRRLHDDALEAATERAREKAERVAAAEGLAVGSLREATTTDSVGGMQSIVDEALFDGGDTAFQPTPITVAASVECVFDLE
ncbi:SIMPL domain-containing protein [Halorarius litoreus]|uniref:SIMPL domain-containing protein n=1 Tax=Halorarius litoreus TaxID=2962676 RepID=UPI0020CBA03C|nr:SIMPL domain-containing protein [Halorarius litoreus]